MDVNFSKETQNMVLKGLDLKKWVTIEEKTFEERGMAHKMLFEIQKALPEGAWIAGGCFERAIHDEPIKDIDIFFRDENTFMQAFDTLTAEEDVSDMEFDNSAEGVKINEGKGWYSNLINKESEEMESIISSSKTRFVVLTKNNRPDIQLIKTMWYPSLEAVLHGFDFTATQIGTKTDLNNNVSIVMNPMSLSDIHRKRLVLWRMTFPSSTIRRMIKYAQKGYYACGGALVTIALSVQNQLNTHPDTTDVQYVD